MPSNSKMSRRKTLCIKLSLALNLCVLLYTTIQYLDTYLNPNDNLHSGENVSHQRTLNSIGEKFVNLNQTLIPTTVPTSLQTSSREIKQPILCYERDTRPRKAMRGQYWTLYNYIPGQLKLKCNETITYTTHR